MCGVCISLHVYGIVSWGSNSFFSSLLLSGRQTLSWHVCRPDVNRIFKIIAWCKSVCIQYASFGLAMDYSSAGSICVTAWACLWLRVYMYKHVSISYNLFLWVCRLLPCTYACSFFVSSFVNYIGMQHTHLYTYSVRHVRDRIRSGNVH